jgi:hypothetical protein
MARRNEIWFGFVAAPTMAAAIQHLAARHRIASGTRPGRPRFNLAIAALVLLLAVLSLPWLRPYIPWPQGTRSYLYSGTPIEAVAFLRELPQPRRVFQREGYGSYMIWASPEVPVFIDTRFELYPLEQWQDYIAISQGRYNWQQILAQYAVDTLLLERATQSSLIQAAEAAAGWHLAYEDNEVVVFLKAEAP